MPGTTHIVGFRDGQALRDGAASFQALGYKTVQVGPSKDVTDRPGGVVQDWPFDGTKEWFVLIATKDPITPPSSGVEEDS